MSSENDFDTSVLKALEEIDPEYHKYHGLLAVGSHTPVDLDFKLEKLKEARENKIPTLGICLGMQMMVIEYARNILRLQLANSTEVDPKSKYQVIHKLNKLRVGIKPVIWNNIKTMESHWHNYWFNNYYKDRYMEDWDMSFSGGILEVMRLKGHPHFLGIQFHAEYQSSKEKPHPILVEFVEQCKSFNADGLHR